jgi:hypothetical protein
VAAALASPAPVAAALASPAPVAAALAAAAPVAAALASPAPVAAGTPAPRGAAGGATIHMPITITIEAPPGADTQALAALVRRAVAQAGGEAAGRVAALYDRGDGL